MSPLVGAMKSRNGISRQVSSAAGMAGAPGAKAFFGTRIFHPAIIESQRSTGENDPLPAGNRPSGRVESGSRRPSGTTKTTQLGPDRNERTGGTGEFSNFFASGGGKGAISKRPSAAGSEK